MAKPNLIPTWATDALAAIVNPGTTKQGLGWVQEKPPHEFFNWWQNLVGEWVNYLQNSVNSYATLQDLLTDVAVGDLGYLTRPAVDPWAVLYTKDEADLGGAGHTAERVVAVESDFVVATAFVGTDTYLRAFQINGSERWNRNTGAADITLDLTYDGSYIAWTLRDNGTGIERVEIIDPSDGSLLHTIAENNASGAQGDGAVLYICRDNNQVLAYSNYWDSGTINNDWSTAITMNTAEFITTDGTRVVVTGANGSSTNTVVLDNAGNIIGSDEFSSDGVASGDLGQVGTDGRNLYAIEDTGSGIMQVPAYLADNVGGSWPPSLGASTNPLLTRYQQGGTNDTWNATRFALGWGYLALTSGLVAVVLAHDGKTWTPLVSFVEQWDTDINDVALGPLAFAYAGDENGDGNAVIVRALPPEGRLLQVVDPATEPRRAPTWTSVHEVGT